MSIKLNKKEILEIALGIEENGEKFYRKAAEQVDDPEVKSLLVKLADWEKGHKSYFGGLLKETEADSDGLFRVSDYSEEVSLYLKAIADSNVFKTGLPVEELLGDLTSVKGIIDKALEREKDAVTYFSAVKFGFTLEKDQKNIDKIIAEELSHIRYLMEIRNELK